MNASRQDKPINPKAPHCQLQKSTSMVQVKIVDNPMKLLARTFLHLLPVRDGEMLTGSKYPCISEEYGSLGVVEVVTVFSVQLYDLKATPMLLAVGHQDTKQQLNDSGYLYTEAIQHAVCRFVRRNDDAFTKLIDTETRKAGINIIRQPQIF